MILHTILKAAFAPLMALAIILALPVGVSADNPFSDDFESYGIGQLTMGDAWYWGGNYDCAISGSVSHGGSQALACAAHVGSYVTAARASTKKASGEWGVWINNNALQTDHGYISVSETAGSNTCGRINFVKSGSLIEYRGCTNSTCSTYATLGTTAMNSWQKIGFKWDVAGSNNKLWYHLNGTESAQLANISTCDLTDGVGAMNVFLNDFTNAAAAIYVDDVGDYPLTDSITITYPADGQTMLAAVDKFTVSWQTTRVYPRLSLGVCYGTNSATVTACTATTTTDVMHNGYSYVLNAALSGSDDITVNNILAADTTYYAKAILGYNSTSTPSIYYPLEESAVIDFATHNQDFGNATSTLDFYSTNVPAVFGTSTPTIVYTSITTLINAIFSPIAQLLDRFKALFDTQKAEAWGTEAGAAIGIILAYAGNLEAFGAFPILTGLIVLVIVNVAIFTLNWALKLKKLIY